MMSTTPGKIMDINILRKCALRFFLSNSKLITYKMKNIFSSVAEHFGFIDLIILVNGIIFSKLYSGKYHGITNVKEKIME